MTLTGGLDRVNEPPLVINVGALAKFPRLVIVEADDANALGYHFTELAALSPKQLDELALALCEYAAHRFAASMQPAGAVVTVQPAAARIDRSTAREL